MNEALLKAHVRFANPADQDALLDACMDAFADEAVLSWVIPRAQERQAIAMEMFATRLEAAVEARQVIIAVADEDRIIGVVLLRDEPEEDGTFQPTLQGADETSKRLAVVERMAAQARPRDTHILIESIAVCGRFRGMGIGMMLLDYCAALADRFVKPLFLMASTPASVRLYVRSGFEEIGGPIALPDDGPHLQPMWRGATARES